MGGVIMLGVSFVLAACAGSLWAVNWQLRVSARTYIAAVCFSLIVGTVLPAN